MCKVSAGTLPRCRSPTQLHNTTWHTAQIVFLVPLKSNTNAAQLVCRELAVCSSKRHLQESLDKARSDAESRDLSRCKRRLHMAPLVVPPEVQQQKGSKEALAPQAMSASDISDYLG